MTEYQLSSDELEMLEGLGDESKPMPATASSPAPAKKKPATRKKKSVDLDEDSASFTLLKDLCDNATRIVTKAYGASGCAGFEVASGCVLPYVDGSGNENFVGMESLTFKKVIPTRHKGGILCVFSLEVSRPDVAVWLDDLETVFGKRGRLLRDYINGPAIRMSEEREKILASAVAVDRAAVYKGVDEYGTW